MKPSYLQKTELFMKRFNCASHKVLKSHGALAYGGDEVSSFVGIKPPSKHTIVWEVNKNATSYNPIIFLIEGRRRITGCPTTDLSRIIGIETCINPFLQGFANIPRYRDAWDGYGPADILYQYYGFYFNLGRAFLEKFCRIKLNHQLPKEIKDVFDRLK